MGARASKPRKYDTEAVVKKADREISPNQWADIERMSGNALDWVTSRGNIGDGVDKRRLSAFDSYVCQKRTEKALRAGIRVLSGKMHPTARDIVGESIKQLVYSATGQRLHTFREDK